jgi:hypothetical protein
VLYLVLVTKLIPDKKLARSIVPGFLFYLVKRIIPFYYILDILNLVHYIIIKLLLYKNLPYQITKISLIVNNQPKR